MLSTYTQHGRNAARSALTRTIWCVPWRTILLTTGDHTLELAYACREAGLPIVRIDSDVNFAITAGGFALLGDVPFKDEI
jgi:hypothetical protein